MRLIQTDETQKELSEQIKALYIQAFPKAERKPYAVMEKKQQQGRMQIWAIVEDRKENTEVLKTLSEFCGLAITILYKDMVLLDYFAIHPEKRGNGIGSKALNILKEKYAEQCFFLEIESTNMDAKDLSEKERQIRIKRKQFYHRNGMKDTGLEVILFGIQMEVLSAGKAVDYKEYHNLYEVTFGKKAAARVECVGR